MTDSERFRYCTLPVEEDEFEALEAAYDSIPKTTRDACREAEYNEKVARWFVARATTLMNEWAKSVLGNRTESDGST